MNGSWDVYVAPPTDFARMDDIIINLAKEREPGIERTYSLIYIIVVDFFGFRFY